MGAGTTIHPNFLVRPVLVFAWALVKSHFALLCIVAVVLHFVAWKFTAELQGSLVDYLDQTFRLDLVRLASGEMSGWLEDSELFVGVLRSVRDQGGVGGLAYLILLQVAVTTLTFGAASRAQAERSSLGTGHILIAERFRRAEFLFDVMRSLGILMVNVAMLAAGLAAFGLALFVFELEYFHFLHSVAWIELLYVLSVSLVFLGFIVTITLRWLLATPITIVEDTGVLESIGRSWRLTRHCWKKLLAVISLAWLPISVAAGVISALGGLDEAASLALTANWMFSMIANTLSALLVSVCYYHLRGGAGAVVDAPGDSAASPA